MSFLGFALLLWQAIAPQTVQNPRVELPVQMGYRVNPDTVLVGQPFNLTRTKSKIAAPPPGLGQHTDEVLKEFGFKPKEIAALRAAKAL